MHSQSIVEQANTVEEYGQEIEDVEDRHPNPIAHMERMISRNQAQSYQNTEALINFQYRLHQSFVTNMVAAADK